MKGVDTNERTNQQLTLILVSRLSSEPCSPLHNAQFTFVFGCEEMAIYSKIIFDGLSMTQAKWSLNMLLIALL
jgi:hypothetical protein